MVHQKKNEKENRMKKGQTMKNLSNFKLDCPNKLQIFSNTFTNCCFKLAHNHKNNMRVARPIFLSSSLVARFTHIISVEKWGIWVRISARAQIIKTYVVTLSKG